MKAQAVIGGGGVRLHVDEAGKRDGLPIVLIHGLSQCRLAWRKQMVSDLAREFRLLAPDIRGHGLSDKPRDAYRDNRLWADDLHAIITGLELDRPVLCGWSYGGIVICDYLRVYGEARIAGINFVCGVTELDERLLEVVGGDYPPLVPALCSDDAEVSGRGLAEFVRMCVYEEPAPEDFYCALGYNTAVPPHVRRALIERTVDNDDVLRSIRKPVLFTHGERDAVLLSEASRRHAALVPHARTSFYPESGHSPFWEAPMRFNRELREFALAAAGER